MANILHKGTNAIKLTYMGEDVIMFLGRPIRRTSPIVIPCSQMADFLNTLPKEVLDNIIYEEVFLSSEGGIQ